MKKILVPTDFSRNALKAVTYAAEIAEKSGAVIYLLHVIEPSINMVTMQTDSSGKEVLNERGRKLILLQKTVADIYPGVKVIIHLLGGKSIDSILKYTEMENMDLIVMGTTGANGLKELFIGSVAAGVIGKTKIPVLTVPVSHEIQPPHTILLTTNQFEKSKNILNEVVGISKLFSAIHVVVIKDEDGNENADFIYNEEQLNNYLQFLKETFPGVNFKGEILIAKDFELTIDSYSNKNQVDVIAMITYPKSFMEKVFRKGVTRKMAFHSTIPILAIPAIC